MLAAVGIFKDLGLTWRATWIGVVSGLGIYIAVLLVTRLLGQRSLSTMSSYDFPVTVAIGAIVGRTALAKTSLLGGIVALVTLFLAQSGVSWLRNHGLMRILDEEPILLMAGPRVLHDNLRRARLSDADLLEKLRMNGVTQLDQVRFAVMERSGGISVVTGDDPVDDELLEHVIGAEELAVG